MKQILALRGLGLDELRGRRRKREVSSSREDVTEENERTNLVDRTDPETESSSSVRVSIEVVSDEEDEL